MANTYTLKYTGKKAAAVNMLALLEEGKPGEVLVRRGFGKRDYCSFLASLAKAADALTEEELADLFSAIDAGNASAASQACSEITVDFGDGPLSLAKHWGSGDKPAASPSAILAKLKL